MIDPRLDDPSEDLPVDAPEDHRRFSVQFIRDYRGKRGVRTVAIHGVECMRETVLARRIVQALTVANIQAVAVKLDPSIRRVDVEITGNYDGRHDSAIVLAVRMAIWSHGNAGKSDGMSIVGK